MDAIKSKNCSNFKNLILNFDNDKLQWIKYNFSNIRTYNYKNDNKSSIDCLISENGLRFNVINQKSSN